MRKALSCHDVMIWYINIMLCLCSVEVSPLCQLSVRLLSASSSGNLWRLFARPVIDNHGYSGAVIWGSRDCYTVLEYETSLIAKFMGPTWGPSGADRTQLGPMLTSWTLLPRMASAQLVLPFIWLAMSTDSEKKLDCTWFCSMGRRRGDSVIVG